MMHDWKKTKRYKQLRGIMWMFSYKGKLARKRMDKMFDDFSEQIKKYLGDIEVK